MEVLVSVVGFAKSRGVSHSQTIFVHVDKEAHKVVSVVDGAVGFEAMTVPRANAGDSVLVVHDAG